MILDLANASDTREVIMVIQRRTHCSANVRCRHESTGLGRGLSRRSEPLRDTLQQLLNVLNDVNLVKSHQRGFPSTRWPSS